MTEAISNSSTPLHKPSTPRTAKSVVQTVAKWALLILIFPLTLILLAVRGKKNIMNWVRSTSASTTDQVTSKRFTDPNRVDEGNPPEPLPSLSHEKENHKDSKRATAHSGQERPIGGSLSAQNTLYGTPSNSAQVHEVLGALPSLDEKETHKDSVHETEQLESESSIGGSLSAQNPSYGIPSNSAQVHEALGALPSLSDEEETHKDSVHETEQLELESPNRRSSENSGEGNIRPAASTLESSARPMDRTTSRELFEAIQDFYKENDLEMILPSAFNVESLSLIFLEEIIKLIKSKKHSTKNKKVAVQVAFNAILSCPESKVFQKRIQDKISIFIEKKTIKQYVLGCLEETVFVGINRQLDNFQFKDFKYEGKYKKTVEDCIKQYKKGIKKEDKEKYEETVEAMNFYFFYTNPENKDCYENLKSLFKMAKHKEISPENLKNVLLKLVTEFFDSDIDEEMFDNAYQEINASISEKIKEHQAI